MKKARPEDRLAYWKHHVAAHSFEQARDVALRLQGVPDPDPLFLPLNVALHVFYARPFKHEQKTRRIDTAMVPPEFASVHDRLLDMRDRIFAHHDKDCRITDQDTGVDLFQLVVVVSGGRMRPGVQLVFPTPRQVGKVTTLCDRLYRACMGKAEEALIRCIGVVPDDGIYRVSTDFEGCAPLLIRSEISTEQSRGHLKETKRRMPEARN
jgi:hypothetical protein